MTTRSTLLAVLISAVLSVSGCGAADAPQIPDDGLTVNNPHDGLWQDRGEAPIRFDLEQTFGAEEEPVEAALSFVRQVVVDEDGNLYVHDGFNPDRLLSFDADGSLRWAIEANGQGPGELNSPSGLVWTDRDGLLVLNQRGTRLETFNANGTFEASRPLAIEGFFGPDLVGMIHQDHLVLTRTLGWLRSEIRIGLADSTVTSDIAIENDQGHGREAIGFYFGVPVYTFRDHVAVAYMDEYRIELYDTTGTLKRVVRRDMHDLVPPGHAELAGRSTGGQFGRLSSPIEISGGHWIVSASWPTNVEDPDQFMLDVLNGAQPERVLAWAIDLYDERDRLLYTLSGEGPTPEVGRPIMSDDEGRLYTVVDEPYPQIRRYRVTIDD